MSGGSIELSIVSADKEGFIEYDSENALA